MSRERFGSIAIIVLALVLILFGVSMLISIAIPAWVFGLMFVAAGLLLLVGR